MSDDTEKLEEVEDPDQCWVAYPDPENPGKFIRVKREEYKG